MGCLAYGGLPIAYIADDNERCEKVCSDKDNKTTKKEQLDGNHETFFPS